MVSKIEGVLPVLHMPYEEDESIDYATLQKEVDYLFDTGAHGLCLALVSDLLRLTAEERLTLPEHLVRWAAGRGPPPLGWLSTSTRCSAARSPQ